MSFLKNYNSALSFLNSIENQPRQDLSSKCSIIRNQTKNWDPTLWSIGEHGISSNESSASGKTCPIEFRQIHTYEIKVEDLQKDENGNIIFARTSGAYHLNLSFFVKSPTEIRNSDITQIKLLNKTGTFTWQSDFSKNFSTHLKIPASIEVRSRRYGVLKISALGESSRQKIDNLQEALQSYSELKFKFSGVDVIVQTYESTGSNKNEKRTFINGEEVSLN